MKNKYEFKLEEINKVKVVSVDELSFVVEWTRKNDREFLETFYANRDESSLEDEGTVGIICPRCSLWNYFKKEEVDKPNFEYKCKCGGKEELYAEEDIKKNILCLLNPEDFYGIILYINDIRIY